MARCMIISITLNLTNFDVQNLHQLSKCLKSSLKSKSQKRNVVIYLCGGRVGNRIAREQTEGLEATEISFHELLVWAIFMRMVKHISLHCSSVWKQCLCFQTVALMTKWVVPVLRHIFS